MNTESSLLSDYLTKRQLAAELGVTERTIGRWMRKAGGIPHTRIGGQLVFRIASVRSWIESHETYPGRRKARRQ
ncbi:helix-turn-helix domain-containing protein [Parvularcula flava]|uniref:Helix-turn-helix domain-containing protein n=1 Tax=Aquisalinus luteolus TaxID=1566827 RepID=A0A8J3EU33_9PROT|nr:helix-turn-helix domain-containing protein [Aquisalinus luteolus]GGH95960.1 hypothetical protein GCM10011355_13740 [Aquisalinus luteolus]